MNRLYWNWSNFTLSSDKNKFAENFLKSDVAEVGCSGPKVTGYR
ncbi:hypothetical protein VCHA52P453_50215 [Vibrio chagasii]|nr:hypothetical protein VCHA39P226_50004 [Vibrio chagasii]CAH7367089.1 hypothetical protein VCHA49P381_50206 [Vibrio chagasii]CAH7375911.1 hypothetical protein VCHA52P453_50215 [Vibrio chagasii]CAH7389005.1 hypothetical protein VCHA52P456_70003 [Vibrio chagasii]